MNDVRASSRWLHRSSIAAIGWSFRLFAIVFTGWMLAKWREWDNVAAGLMVAQGVLLLWIVWSDPGWWSGTSGVMRFALLISFTGGALGSIFKGVTNIILRNQP